MPIIDWRELLTFFCRIPTDQLFPPETPGPDLGLD